ncbi:HAD family hydrolase [Thioalkalivibrio paradoxus]|uniref:HAD family hydrolase n=1 Tax=Thioalkalivibrio paradoxus TaxID=108010 RepID=UPI00022C56EF|nr:HAD-IA family hydrolase [Thioalkalivibrio paradoxus]
MIPRSDADALALVVFDWDGTLMDSVARIVNSLRQAIDDIGAEPRSESQLRDIIGLGVRQATQALYPGSDDAFTDALARAYRLHYLELDTTPTPLYPGAEQVLEQLAGRGFLLAVATGKSRRGLDAALEQTSLGRFFDATATADEHPSKPDPGMLGYLVDRLGVDGRDAVMVGDSSYDLEMAQRLGVAGIGITHGVHCAEILLRHAPLALIGSLGELPPLLEPRGSS